MLFKFLSSICSLLMVVRERGKGNRIHSSLKREKVLALLSLYSFIYSPSHSVESLAFQGLTKLLSGFIPLNQKKLNKMEGASFHLKRQLLEYTASLFKEGYLDDQFTQLQSLQDEDNPDFVEEVVSLFFEDSERLINELAKALSQKSIDFKKLDAHVHQLKGSSSSIGANKVQRTCIAFRQNCEAQNVEGCLKCLQQVRDEFSLVKKKLETLFKLEQQLMAVHAHG